MPTKIVFRNPHGGLSDRTPLVVMEEFDAVLNVWQNAKPMDILVLTNSDSREVDKRIAISIDTIGYVERARVSI